MEDKWFAFVAGDRLHLHRSWTGLEVFSAEIRAEPDGGAQIVEVLVNDDGQFSERWEPSEDLTQLLDFLIADV